ncbi:MAG: acetoacetate metabolism regulatory protein AtoC [Chitinophagales bacterium]|nr:MAG: acetoacetate metabolism regulatory protein AtoC [Chitinophagales bacterium]
MSPINHALKIFIVEDDDWYSKMLAYTLGLNPNDTVAHFKNGKEFLKQLDENPDVVTLDFRLPDVEGAELLRKIKSFNPEIDVIIISGQESIETAVSLLKDGAYDYIVKQKDIRERLLNTIRNLRNKKALKEELSELKKEVTQKYQFQNSLVGNSPAFSCIFPLIEKAAATNITVTLTGETGTGKEMVARAIHFNSARRNARFVAVNVAAIPDELIESELFGHEKGAFTGAVTQRIGKFEESHKGTLFLDEIAEMHPSMQAKLLRVLQEKEVVRLGSNTVIKVDCRIIVATHRNLLEEVKKGRFREDLYYRLYGLTIHLPPLRQRDNDIILLARHFLQSFCRENKMELKTISPEAQMKLKSYSYPGNVRELKSIIELAAVMSDGKDIKSEHILFGDNDSPEYLYDHNQELTLREYTDRIIKLYLKKYHNNIKLVAQKLDIGQSTIYRLLKNEKERSES